jgi:hypothetical protein
MSGGTGQYGDSFRRVMPGEPMRIEARAWNACVDAAEAVVMTRPSPKSSQRDRRSSGLVLIRNDSGDDVSQYGILGVSGILIAAADNEIEFRQRVLLTGVTPEAGTHEGRFVVTLEPIADGEIGLACASGVIQVPVQVSDEGHRYAEIDDGIAGNLASSGAGSALILACDTGEGLKWAVVRLGTAAGTARNPKRLGPLDGEGEWDLASETAATDEWDIDDQGEYDGVEYVPHRTVYNAAGDKILYEFYRPPTHNSMGCLVHVGPETRVTVDTPTLCTAVPEEEEP